MTDSLKTDLLCPVCGEALACDPEGRRFFCDAGHSYDRARAGYVHLLLPNRAGSDTPGDDREMVRARSTFLESGAYAPLSDAVNSLCMAFARSGEYTAPLLLADAGCGEGYYTNRLAAALQSCGVDARVYGFDVSKHACAHGAAAARRQGLCVRYAVASLFAIPMAAQSCDVLVNIFAPCAQEEFHRVLRRGGLLCMVEPAADHLLQLKKILYDTPYENKTRRDALAGFALRQVEPLRYSFLLGAHRMELLHMTPYYFRTPREGIARLRAQVEPFEVMAAFDVLLYERL